MAQYRYVGGGPAEIWDTPYNFQKFGQLVELSDELAAKAKAGRIALMSAEDFNALGFTSEELKKFNKFESHRLATSEFINKRSKAWLAAQAIHREAAKPPAAEPSESSSLEADTKEG